MKHQALLEFRRRFDTLARVRGLGRFARKLGCPTPLFSATAPLYNSAMAMALGDADTASVCAVLERMASLKRPARPRRNAPHKKGPRIG